MLKFNKLYLFWGSSFKSKAEYESAKTMLLKEILRSVRKDPVKKLEVLNRFETSLTNFREVVMKQKLEKAPLYTVILQIDR